MSYGIQDLEGNFKCSYPHCVSKKASEPEPIEGMHTSSMHFRAIVAPDLSRSPSPLSKPGPLDASSPVRRPASLELDEAEQEKRLFEEQQAAAERVEKFQRIRAHNLKKSTLEAQFKNIEEQTILDYVTHNTDIDPLLFHVTTETCENCDYYPCGPAIDCPRLTMGDSSLG